MMLKVTSRKAVAPRPRYKPKMPFSFNNWATKAKEETFEGDLAIPAVLSWEATLPSSCRIIP